MSYVTVLAECCENSHLIVCTKLYTANMFYLFSNGPLIRLCQCGVSIWHDFYFPFPLSFVCILINIRACLKVGRNDQLFGKTTNFEKKLPTPRVLPHPFSISQSWLFFLKVGRFFSKLVVFPKSWLFWPKSWSFWPTFKQALLTHLHDWLHLTDCGKGSFEISQLSSIFRRLIFMLHQVNR